MKFLTPHRNNALPNVLTRSPGVAIVTMVLVITIFFTFSNMSFQNHSEPTEPSVPAVQLSNEAGIIPQDNAQADLPFMPKMEDEKLKAELGNAAWRLLHTILARYPDEPTESERQHLVDYIYSFAQVYPCGDCARHFIQLLAKYPPQTNSRKNAALWGCHIHNKVNARLGHAIYDCTNILEDYDCGCGEDEEAADDTLKGNTAKDLQASKKGETEDHLKSIKVESKEDHVAG